MDFNGWSQVALILATIMPFLYSLHVQNRNRSNENMRKLDAIGEGLKKHEKRTKRLRRQLMDHLFKHSQQPQRKEDVP